MPIYEYDCAKCAKTHEIIQKFSDPPLTQCPDCGSQISKRMSLSSFALQGSGWYTSDYKKKSSSPQPPQAKDPASCEKPACGTAACATIEK